jgi:haloalkane dehalogenase
LRERYRVVAIDHLGCGLSDKPQDWPYRLGGHVANLRALIERLDLKNITLLAQDWGGAIGLGAAVAEPQRFSRFVLFNTGAFHGGRMPVRIGVCRMPVLGPLAVRGGNAFARAALHMTMRHPERLTPEIRAGILAPYGNWRDRVAIQRFVEDIPLAPSHPSYETLSAIEQGLPSLAGRPAQLIWGMRDWCFTPWFLDRFEQIFPQAEVHRLADAGHWVVEDAHEQIVPMVTQFLAKHPT